MNSWFENFCKSPDYQLLQQRPLAYFSIEYALSDMLPTYAGGLGILAGDYVRELHDQKIPAVGVGLYYQSKYGTYDLPLSITAEEQGLQPVLGKDGKPLIVKVPIHDHDVLVKAWKWEKDSVPVYLLDTNVEENATSDREIGFKLYDANKETRLKQEMVLGIGGFRLLEALELEPSIYHMNEGHSSMLILEIIRHQMRKRTIGFGDAIKMASHHIVFTNHTLVAAGNEIFSNELVGFLLIRYAGELEIPVADLLSLGTIQESNSFSLSLFARRLAGRINAVSQLHAKETLKVWPDYDIETVTNGIHLETWDEIRKEAKSEKRKAENGNGDENNISERHKENKRKLLEIIKENTGLVWGEDEILLGWARRIVPYKRPLALFAEIERLKQLALNPVRPIRLIMSGITHQSDDEGHDLLEALQEIIRKELPKSAVYLPDYNASVAKLLTSGCDVWLNTPVVGSEACGTSGMKAALNGALPVTTKDGWVTEVNLYGIGWIVDSDTVSVSLLDVLKEEVLPLYYTDKPAWEANMNNARQLIQNEFSTTRMLREYFEKIYLPIIRSAS